MCLLFPKGGTGEPKIAHMPNNEGDQKSDHLCPQDLSFCGRGGTFDISFVTKSECRT